MRHQRTPQYLEEPLRLGPFTLAQWIGVFLGVLVFWQALSLALAWRLGVDMAILAAGLPGTLVAAAGLALTADRREPAGPQLLRFLLRRHRYVPVPLQGNAPSACRPLDDVPSAPWSLDDEP